MKLMIEDSIKRNLDVVEERITRSAKKSGRTREDIKLIVVTKGQPVDKIAAAYAGGARFFGENYPEETAEKLPHLTDLANIEWHMIGHLQSRKAKIVAESFTMMHSLDSLHTAEKLERLLAEKGKILPVLIEINTGDEESKSGLLISDEGQKSIFFDFIDQLQKFEHLSIKGLMTMPPLFEDPGVSRPNFQKLRRLGEELRVKFAKTSWEELSMGTSSDFETAIEEGSTMVRLGHAILGPRNYEK